MTETLETVTKKKPEATAEQQAAEELVRQAREQGLSLTGPDGLLKQLTKVVIETALDQELTEHLGHERNTPAGNATGNVRNGARPKTVLTGGTGQVGIQVPRDRDGTFEPQIVKKRQRRLNGAGEIVLSLYAKGLTTGEISAHFAEIYGASVSKETISRITDRVIEEMQAWAARPLDEVYAAVFIDAIMVKVRDGQVANRPVYAAIGVTLAGEKDVLGLWAGTGGEGAKFWMSVLTDLRNRGIKDVFFVVCDGLKGLPDVVANAWPQAIVQTCIVHYPDTAVMPIPGLSVLAGLGRHEAGRQAHLHGGERRRGPRRPGRAGRQMGEAVRGRDPALGERLGTVHPVPGLRPGDPHGHLLHQRDRIPERPVPAGSESQRSLPDRAGRDQVPLPGHPVP